MDFTAKYMVIISKPPIIIHIYYMNDCVEDNLTHIRSAEAMLTCRYCRVYIYLLGITILLVIHSIDSVYGRIYTACVHMTTRR